MNAASPYLRLWRQQKHLMVAAVPNAVDMIRALFASPAPFALNGHEDQQPFSLSRRKLPAKNANQKSPRGHFFKFPANLSPEGLSFVRFAVQSVMSDFLLPPLTIFVVWIPIKSIFMRNSPAKLSTSPQARF
jgi:hypothetical protein